MLPPYKIFISHSHVTVIYDLMLRNVLSSDFVTVQTQSERYEAAGGVTQQTFYSKLL
jgi:hypothetical protein